MKLRNILTLLTLTAISLTSAAYDIVWLHNTPNGRSGIIPTRMKNALLSADGSQVVVTEVDGTVHNLPADGFRHVTFGQTDGSIDIKFGAAEVYSNPLAFDGVDVRADGDKIVVTNKSDKSLTINVSGTSSAGQIKVYSSTPVKLVCDNTNITNDAGSAINLQVTAGAEIVFNGNCSFCDSKKYTTPADEDENATIFCQGNLTISGPVSSTVTVDATKKHAICSKTGSVTVKGSTIKVESSASDGIHCVGFNMQGGEYYCKDIVGDPIDADTGEALFTSGYVSVNAATKDTKGIKADGNVTITGDAVVIVYATGDQTKAIKSKADIVFDQEAYVQIIASGNAVLVASLTGVGYEPSYCTAVKADGNFVMNNGELYVTHTGKGGKGISADLNATFNGGVVQITCKGDGATYTNSSNANEAYSSTCITVDGNIMINGGEFTLSNAGTAGKCIKADGTITIGTAAGGPTIDAHTSGARILESSGTSSGGWGRPGGGFDNNADYSNPKVIKAVGNLTVNNGKLTLRSSGEGGEGLESKKTVTITGGDINCTNADDCINATTAINISGGVVRCQSTKNDAIDSNGTITISGGVIIALGTSDPECGFDCDSNRFAITGGYVVGVGGSTSNPTTSACTQRTVILGANLGQNVLLSIVNPSGKQVISFKNSLATGTWRVLISAPGITTGTHSICTGGTLTGGTTEYEVTYGATITGANSAYTFSPTSMVTTVGSTGGPGGPGGRP